MPDNWPGLDDFVASAPAPVAAEPAPNAQLDEAWPGMSEFTAAATPEGQSNRRMAEARYRAAGQELTTAGRIGEHIPFVAGSHIFRAQQYSEAMGRIRAGNPEQRDYQTVAEHERYQQLRGQLPVLEQASSAVAPLVGETLLSGGIAGSMAGAAAPAVAEAAAPSIAARAASFAGRTLATQATTPTMWNIPQGIEQNVQAGRDTFDLRGLAPAAALGTIQTAVLGSLGPLTNRIAGTGLERALARGVAGTGIGMAEQQLADMASSAIGQFVLGERAGEGLNTGYGLAGNILRGDDDAFKHAMIQAITFAAFSGIHQAQRPVEIRDLAYDASRALARRGMSRTEAGAVLADVGTRFEQAAAQGLGRAEVTAMFEHEPDPNVRRYAAALAESIPESVQSPQTATSAPEKPQVQEIQHLPAQGPEPGRERPMEAPRPPEAQIPAQPAPEAPAGQPARPATVPEAVGRPTEWHQAYREARRRGLSHDQAVALTDAAHETGQTWVHSGTEFTGPDRNEFTAGGQRQTIAEKLYPDGGVRLGIPTVEGERAQVVFTRNSDGTYSASALRSGERGLARALYDYATNAGMKIVPSKEGRTGEGKEFWRKNAEATTGLQPEAPKSPLAELDKETLATLAKSLGLTVKSLKAQEHLPWVKAVVDTMQGRVAPPTPPQAAPTAPLSLQERMRQRTGPAPEPGAGLQHAEAGPSPMRELRSRFQAGEHVELKDAFKTAGLDAREEHVLTERMTGRSQDDIASDKPVLKAGGARLTRAMISVIEKSAMKKLGLEGHTVESLILSAERAEGVAELAANGQRVNVAELGADPRMVQAAKDRLIGRDKALESKVDKLIEAYEKELKDGPLNPDRVAYYVAEHTRLARQLEGAPANAPAEPTGEPAGLVNEPPPVRGAANRGVQEVPEVPTPVPPDQGTQGLAQGNAEVAPSPAGRNLANQGLSKAEVMRRGQAIPKRYAAEAESEGIPADHVHRAFLDHLAIDQAGVRLQNELYDGIKKAVEEQGTTMQAMSRMIASGRADAIRGLDDVVRRLDGPERTLLERMMQEHNLDSAEAAREVLEGGRREPRRQEELYGNALDELIGMREAQKEIDRANTENRRSGQPEFTQAEIEEARRKAEQDPNYDPWAEDVPAGQRSEGAEGQAAEAGANEPGEFDFGLSTRLPIVPEQRGSPELGAGIPAGAGAEPAGFGKPVSPAERGVIPAGGQENVGAAERPGRITALANAMVDKERAKKGLPELMSAARLENATVWDQAMARLDKDPQAGARLVEELAKKPRATTVQENALLLQRKIALANEHERAMLDYVRAFHEKADAITMDRLEAREREVFGQVDQLDKVTRTTGTEWGRAGQFRRQLALEDFSLSSMLMRAEVAKGRPLTDPEKAQVVALNQRITDLQGKLDAAEKALIAQGKGIKSASFPELQNALVEANRAKGEFNRQLEGDRQANRPLGRKLEDLLIKWRRASVISSPLTMAKIIAASAERMIISPMEEAAGAVLSRMPGLSKIAAAAPREGRGLRAGIEQRAFIDGLSKGMVDAWTTLRRGESDLDVLYGHTDAPRSWLDFVGELHAAGKAPAVRAEYTRSFLQRIDAEVAAGRDVSSPAALMRVGVEAYKDSQRAKFQQDNRVVDAWKRAISTLTAPEASGGARALGTGMKLLVPVVRVPTNLVAEAFQYAFGSVTGSVRAAAALAKGVQSLKPAEADAIMRSLKKGSLGLAVMALGYFNPDMIGGFFSGRRREEDVKEGTIRTGIGDIPAWAMHNPLLEVLQFGATVRRAADSVGPAGHQSFAAAAGQGILGLAEQVPFVRETVEVGRVFNPRQRGVFFGQLAKSFAVPQFFQWIAGRMDLNAAGEPTRRNPQSVWQHVKMGIPGMRSQVPAR